MKFIESKSKTYDMYRRIFADEKETLGIGTDKKKKRIIQWLTANKYILPSHLLGKEVKIDETGEYAFIDDPKLGKGKISFNPNDYVTTKNDDLGIKGLEALRMDTDFPEVRWHKKSIKDLIGDNTIETMMDKPEGLVKLALQGEWLRGLSHVLSLSGGSNVS